MLEKFIELLVEFYGEVGVTFGVTRMAEPFQLETGRFVLEGPKGFTIMEVSPAYTEEEFNAIVGEDETHLDQGVWGSIFSGTLPEEGKDGI